MNIFVTPSDGMMKPRLLADVVDVGLEATG
jgi:hypothetical protein